MANFMGGVQGNRGEATRLGSKYIDAWVKSWENRAVVSIRNFEGKDLISFDIKEIRGGTDFIVDIGNLRLDAEEFNILTNSKREEINILLLKLKELRHLEN